MAGKLYLCPTPIGNLGDMTPRVIETMKSVDLIAAEDTRNSIKLLNHFEIHVPMTSYHEYNKIDKGRVLVGKMLEGQDIALITDAGTPGISDPGQELVRMCIEAGVEVTSLPGASAVITALTLSGLPTRRFCFEGFLPTEKKEQEKVLARLKNETRTTVFYEAPHRLLKTLPLLIEAAGPDRRTAVCKELTKKHESVFRGSLKQALAWFQENPPRGEFVIVLQGADESLLEEERRQSFEQISLQDHMQVYLDQGMSRKEAMKCVAKDRGVSRRQIYAALLEEDRD